MPTSAPHNPPADPSVIPPAPELTPKHAFGKIFQTRVVKPFLDLLRIGATPRKLAWSIAVAAVIGINPIVGSTTLLCLAAAFLFRLNVIATQIVNHLLFPLQLALVVVFMRMGDRLFHTPHVPVNSDAFVHAIRTHNWVTMQMLWTWEWHALIAWLALAVVLIPLLALAFIPVFERLLHRLQTQPIVEK